MQKSSKGTTILRGSKLGEGTRNCAQCCNPNLKGIHTCGLDRMPKTIYLRQIPEKERCVQCKAPLTSYESKERVLDTAFGGEVVGIYQLVRMVKAVEPVKPTKKFISV